MSKWDISPQLAQRKRQLQEELIKIATIEEQELINKHYPALHKKYVGRFFKTENSYSRDDSWWLYTKVVDIKPEDVYDTNGNGVTAHFTGFQFQVTSSGEIHIRDKERGYAHCIGKEISEREFNKAWNSMIEKINSLK